MKPEKVAVSETSTHEISKNDRSFYFEGPKESGEMRRARNKVTTDLGLLIDSGGESLILDP